MFCWALYLLMEVFLLGDVLVELCLLIADLALGCLDDTMYAGSALGCARPPFLGGEFIPVSILDFT